MLWCHGIKRHGDQNPNAGTRDRNSFLKNSHSVQIILFEWKNNARLHFLDIRHNIRMLLCIRMIYFGRIKNRENREKCRTSYQYYVVHSTELMIVWRHTVKNPNAGILNCNRFFQKNRIPFWLHYSRELWCNPNGKYAYLYFLDDFLFVTLPIFLCVRNY